MISIVYDYSNIASQLKRIETKAPVAKDIPILVGGEALIGCRIVEGPFYIPMDDTVICEVSSSEF